MINDIINRLSFNHKWKKCYGKPVIFTIELTNKCNFNCIMCQRQFMKRKQGDMDIELFKHIIRQMEQKKAVWLMNWGEPLLYPHIEEAINYCWKRGIKTRLSTTPDHLTYKNIMKIIKLDELIISFDGVTKETYENIRKGSNFEKAMKGIENYIKIKPKNQKATIRIIKMKKTSNEVEKFKYLWENSGLNVVVKPFDVGTAKEMISLTNKEDLFKETREENKGYCKEPFSSITILWDGKVVPCWKDYDAKYILGDLNKQTLKEVWNSKEMQKLRIEHINNMIGDNPLCKDCFDCWKEEPNIFYPFNKLFKEKGK